MRASRTGSTAPARGLGRRGAVAAGAALAVAISSLVAAPAQAQPQDPTWAQVTAAAANAASAKAEVDTLTALLTGLQADSDRLGAEASARNEDYLQAQAALQAAQQKVAALHDDADAADARAATSQKRADQLIVQLARTGGGDMTAALIGGTASDADSILYRVTAMNRISETTTQIVDQATYEKNAAKALGDQAAAAESVLADREASARSAYEAAQQAAAAAVAQLAATQTRTTTLLAQLASLDAVGSALGEQYLQSASYSSDQASLVAQVSAAAASAVTAISSNRANAAASAAIAASNVGAPDPTAVKTAIDFALAQVGKPYLIAGEGPTAWDCSGLTMKAYAAAGIAIGGHGATLQFTYFQSTKHLVPISQLQPGDLVFYNSTGSVADGKDHVAIYAGSGLIIEAPRAGVPVRVWPMYTQGLVPFAARPSAAPAG